MWHWLYRCSASALPLNMLRLLILAMGTGVAITFMGLGAMYGPVMMAGALSQRLPASAFGTAAGATASEPYVPVETATKLPQFYLTWAGVMGNAMAGIAIISCAKTIMVLSRACSGSAHSCCVRVRCSELPCPSM